VASALWFVEATKKRGVTAESRAPETTPAKSATKKSSRQGHKESLAQEKDESMTAEGPERPEHR
jgi:hypothetical protein